ncbi:MAG: hypothetical protein ACRDQA_02485 [Nocardioidaceae bacterium]
MSIYSTILSLDGDHTPECTVYRSTIPGILDFVPGAECSCGRPNRPYAYRGSHRYPDTAERAGGFDVASISSWSVPGHSDDMDGPPAPWLRLAAAESPYSGGSVVMLSRAQVAELHDVLSEWLTDTEGTS